MLEIRSAMCNKNVIFGDSMCSIIDRGVGHGAQSAILVVFAGYVRGWVGPGGQTGCLGYRQWRVQSPRSRQTGTSQMWLVLGVVLCSIFLLYLDKF